MNRAADTAPPPAAELADEIAEALHALTHLYRARQFRALREVEGEVTQLEARVLGFFGRHPGATQSDLVAHSGRDKGQLARLIGGLRERGLLQSQPDDHDRRVQRLALTDEGRALQAAVQRLRLRVAREAVAGLCDDERRQLSALLGRLRASLEGSGD